MASTCLGSNTVGGDNDIGDTVMEDGKAQKSQNGPHTPDKFTPLDTKERFNLVIMN